MLTIEATHPYPCNVAALLPYFQQVPLVTDKYLGIGATEVQVTVAQQSETIDVISQRQVESDIPRALKSLLGSRNKLIQTEQWQAVASDHFECKFTTKLEGVPITIDGLMVLLDVDDGCENRITLTLKCALPFIGKKLEQFVGESSEEMMEDEYQYLLALFTEAVVDEDQR